jgi:hypothetical protein
VVSTGVTPEIPDSLFMGCSSLSSVTGIANSVTSIGKNAFRDCVSLPSFELPTSLMQIRSWAFWNCRSLQSVGTPPPTLEVIGDHCFGECYSLRTFDVSQTVLTSVETSAFSAAISLQTMRFPPTLRRIREAAFWLTQSLGTVTFNQSSVGLFIGSGAFLGSNFTSVVFPNRTVFAPFALVGIARLRSVTALAPGTTQGTAFSGCACNATCPAVIASVDLQMCDCLPCIAGTTIAPHTGSDALLQTVLYLKSVNTEEVFGVMAVMVNNVTAGITSLSETDTAELVTVALDIAQIARVVQSYGQLSNRVTLQMVDLITAFRNLVHKLVADGVAQPSMVDQYIKFIANFSGESSAAGVDQSALVLPLVEVIDKSLLRATRDLVLLGSSGARYFTSPHAVVQVEVRFPSCC